MAQNPRENIAMKSQVEQFGYVAESSSGLTIDGIGMTADEALANAREAIGEYPNDPHLADLEFNVYQCSKALYQRVVDWGGEGFAWDYTPIDRIACLPEELEDTDA